ncbi:MAG: bifunctional 5,10-methylene-tetrahydrofolate dehydrogenase/5,10-methylene-tetrahydrofolate cyclohydrolase, partial [Flavobacteriales bacterium]|nr:bifunctional 5,10-methylene-tetrahydrofolate dehydrogenase/5,10-methylene-tetrahydrofolate cyclohydrolase [Flavobacteriales bacterium]
MQLLDGLALSKTIKSEIKQIVSERIEQGFKRPHLAAVLIGENGASVTYVNAKVKSCEEVGFDSTLVQLNEDCSEEEVLQTILSLNENDTVDGYIIQLPLPKHINEKKVLMAVSPSKDVDGFHPESVG